MAKSGFVGIYFGHVPLVSASLRPNGLAGARWWICHEFQAAIRETDQRSGYISAGADGRADRVTQDLFPDGEDLVIHLEFRPFFHNRKDGLVRACWAGFLFLPGYL